MRILIVTHYFWPENFRINDLCEALKNRGHDVTVLTGTPNYPRGEAFPEYLADPDAFSVYKGTKVLRVPLVLRGSNSSIRLIANFVSFVLSASTIGIWKLRKKRFDVVFVYEPSPVTVCIPAIVYKCLYKTPVVFWVLDLWPETLEALGVVKSRRVLSTVGKIVRYIYRNCDLILVQSRAFIESIKKYCSQPDKVKYFPSWPDEIELGDMPKLPTALIEATAFKVLFAGNVGEAQDFNSIIKAALEIKARGICAQLFVVGDGRASESVRCDIERYELKDVLILLGRYPLDHMPAFFESSDALLVTLKESDAFSRTIPGKVQSYMAAGKPLLTMLSGEGSRVVEESQAGLTAAAGDFQKLADNIEMLSKMDPAERATLAENAKSYANREFNRSKLILQLEMWFESVAKVYSNDERAR